MAGFNTAVTGLKAAQTDLDVTGNNIANSSTVGFKGSRTEFGDIYATAVVGAGAANVAGSGVTVTDIAQDFKAGTIEFTNNNLDLAINGSGFFQLDDGQGGTTYTRAGAFELDKDGFIVSKNGKYLQGFGLDDQGNQLPVKNLAVTQKESLPNATENIELSFNIDSSKDADSLIQPYDPEQSTTFTYSTTVRTFDSLGNEHTIKYNFVEQPSNREVQTISFSDNDFTRVKDVAENGGTGDTNLDPNISISSAQINLTAIQKMIGVQPELGDIGQVVGVRISDGLPSGVGQNAEQVTFSLQGTADFTIPTGGINNESDTYDTGDKVVSKMVTDYEQDILDAYNSQTAVEDGTKSRLLGVAIDPQDASTMLFQFEESNTSSIPTSIELDNSAGNLLTSAPSDNIPLALTGGLAGVTATENLAFIMGGPEGAFNFNFDVDNSGTGLAGAGSTASGLMTALGTDATTEAAFVAAYNTAAAAAGYSTISGITYNASVAAGPAQAFEPESITFEFDDLTTAPAELTSLLTGTTGLAVGGSTVGQVVGFGDGDTIDVGREIELLKESDPRIAQIQLNDANTNDLVVRFNADATDVEDLQVRDVSDNSLRTDLSISSTRLDSNEVHTYTFNTSDSAVFNADGELENGMTVKIGGVSITLAEDSTIEAVRETINSFQQVILNANPKLEDFEFNTNGELIVTYKPEEGNISATEELEMDLVISADSTSTLMSRTNVVDGDNSYQGVYRMYAYLNGNELLDIGKDVDPGTTGYLGFGEDQNPSEPGPILIKFDSSSGILSEVNGESVVANAPAPLIEIAGADPADPSTTVSLDLTDTTQFASASIVKSSSQDGYTKGDLVGVSFNDTGEMVASFSNGQQQSLGIVAIANFENQAGLTPSGDTEWVATLDSGNPTVNPPGTGLNGTLRSAALEQSNVDLSEELVRLIEAQRNFQANSKTLETLNTVTQSILQI